MHVLLVFNFFCYNLYLYLMTFIDVFSGDKRTKIDELAIKK